MPHEWPEQKAAPPTTWHRPAAASDWAADPTGTDDRRQLRPCSVRRRRRLAIALGFLLAGYEIGKSTLDPGGSLSDGAYIALHNTITNLPDGGIGTYLGAVSFAIGGAASAWPYRFLPHTSRSQSPTGPASPPVSWPVWCRSPSARTSRCAARWSYSRCGVPVDRPNPAASVGAWPTAGGDHPLARQRSGRRCAVHGGAQQAAVVADGQAQRRPRFDVRRFGCRTRNRARTDDASTSAARSTSRHTCSPPPESPRPPPATRSTRSWPR